MVYVKENGSASSTAVSMLSDCYTVILPTEFISINTLIPTKVSPQTIGTTIKWACNITGGSNPVYYFKVFKGSTVVTSSSAYTATNYFNWTPATAGTDYRVMVYVKENGAASSTAVIRISSYYTIIESASPITISSLTPDKFSPQAVRTTIRWTCNITGGSNPVYYFKVFKGGAVITSSIAYAATNYFDWTQATVGTDYRIMVYVKEGGTASSTAVTKISPYYTIN